MCSSARVILASIVTTLLRLKANLMRFFVRINFKSQFQGNDVPQAFKYIKIASKLVTILGNIALAG